MKYILYLSSLFICSIAFGQVPQGFNYQAVAHDVDGDPISNQNVSVRMGILQGSPGGNLNWEEEHVVSTDRFGLFTVIVGQGTSTNGGSFAAFSAIDWANGGHFIRVEVDAGNGYELMGTMQFMTVPYAMYAATSGSGGSNLTPGTGIDINGGVITNTGDTDASDDITNTTGAGGDLSGNYPNPAIDRLQGNPLSAATPTIGDVIVYDGTNWVNQAPAGGSYVSGAGIDITGSTISNTGDTDATNDITTTTAATGDVAGNFPALTVDGLQGVPVGTIAPTNGQVLTYNGSSWVPTAPAGYVAGTGVGISGNTITNTGDTDPSNDITTTTGATGDLSGTYPAPTVGGIQGRPVSTTTPTSGQTLVYNGSSWVPAAPSTQSELQDTDMDTRIETELGTDDDHLRFYTFGTEQMTLTPQGELGLGGPAQDKLTVTSSDTVVSRFVGTGSFADVIVLEGTNPNATEALLLKNASDTVFFGMDPTVNELFIQNNMTSGTTKIESATTRLTGQGGATTNVIIEGSTQSDLGYTTEASQEYAYNAPKTKKLSLPAATFISQSHTYDVGHIGVIKYSYIAGGSAGAIGWLAAPIQLPDGAVITQVDCYVYDNDPSENLEVFIERDRNDGGTGSSTLPVSSSGASTTIQLLTITPNYTIDMDNFYYSLGFSARQSNQQLRMYHCVLHYTVTHE